MSEEPQGSKNLNYDDLACTLLALQAAISNLTIELIKKGRGAPPIPPSKAGNNGPVNEGCDWTQGGQPVLEACDFPDTSGVGGDPPPPDSGDTPSPTSDSDDGPAPGDEAACEKLCEHLEAVAEYLTQICTIIRSKCGESSSE